MPRASSVPNGSDHPGRPDRVAAEQGEVPGRARGGEDVGVVERVGQQQVPQVDQRAVDGGGQPGVLGGDRARHPSAPVAAPGPASKGVASARTAETSSTRVAEPPDGSTSGHCTSRVPLLRRHRAAVGVDGGRVAGVGPPPAVGALGGRRQGRAVGAAGLDGVQLGAVAARLEGHRAAHLGAGPGGDGDLLGHPGVAQGASAPHLDRGVGAGVADVACEQEALGGRARGGRHDGHRRDAVDGQGEPVEHAPVVDVQAGGGAGLGRGVDVTGPVRRGS